MTLGNKKPPNTYHCPVFSSHITMVVECTCDMTVAIIAADIMISLSVRLVCIVNILIELSELTLINSQPYILKCLAKRKLVFTHVVGACKVINNARCVTDACMSDKGQEPCHTRQNRPCDTERESCFFRIHFGHFDISRGHIC